MPTRIRSLLGRVRSGAPDETRTDAGTAPRFEISLVPPRPAASGWLVRLMVLNRGGPATLVADVTRIAGTRQAPTNLPCSLGWRGGETSTRRTLAHGEKAMARLALLRPAAHPPRMTVLSADAAGTTDNEYEWQAGEDLVICVALRDAQNGRTLATKNIAISRNEDGDAIPAVTFLGDGTGNGALASGARFVGAGGWTRTPTALVPEGRVLPGSSTDPTDDDDPPASRSRVARPRRDAPVAGERSLTDRDARFFGNVLRCSNCSSEYDIDSDEIVCRGCGARFPVVDGIPILNKETTIPTALEDLDLEAVGQVNDKLVRNVGIDWTNIVTEIGVRTDEVLEIGSGMGVLTRGLLDAGSVGHMTATDVSEKFLRKLARRTDAYDRPASLVVCDANDPNFRAESFDLVVGRSVLHHLLHYDRTLRQCHAMLKPGGATVFFEPILQGKIFLTLLLAIVLRCDELSGDPQLSPTDIRKVRRVLGFHMKAKLYPQDLESLARLEDKYVFDIDDLRRVGSEAGFSQVDYINNPSLDASMWPRLVWTLRGINVDPSKIEGYRWVAQEFDDTYGLMFGDRIATPMAYFVFHK